MEKHWIRGMAIVLVLSLMLIAPLAFLPASVEAKALKGNKIGLLYETPKTLPANQPSYVAHGSSWDNWSEMPKELRKMSRSDDLTYFKLFINGKEIGLKKDFTRIDANNVTKVWSVQFKANHFIPGTYTFTGVWREWGLLEWTTNVLVTFT